MKDYHKKPVATATRRTQNNNGFSGLMLLFAIIFIGYALFQAATKYRPTLPSKKEIIQKITPSVKSVVSEKKPLHATKIQAAVASDDQPKYDFYKLLPAMTVSVSDKNESGNASTSPIIAGNYVLQVTSLSKASDANQFKTMLKNAGFAAFVQRYQANDHTTWYHVMIGPFADFKTAEQVQMKLDAHQTEALLLKIK